MTRRAYMLAPVLAIASMSAGLLAWISDCRGGRDCVSALEVAVGLAFFVVLITAFVVAGTALLGMLRGHSRSWVCSCRRVILSLSVALVLATPIDLDWDDGCNTGTDRVPAFAAPRVWLTDQAPSSAYIGQSTMVRCDQAPLFGTGVVPVAAEGDRAP